MQQLRKKRLRSMILLVFIFASLRMSALGAGGSPREFMVSVVANAFRSDSREYRQLYGQAVLMPQLKLTCLVYGNFSIWAGFGMVSRQGYIGEVGETAQIDQTLLSLGAGYVQKLSGKLRLRGELGLVRISFKEKALEVVQRGSGVGPKLEVDLEYFVSKRVLVTLAAAYCRARDEMDIGKVELGGAQAGAGVGLVF